MHSASPPASGQSSAPGRFPSGPPDGSHRPPAPKIEWGRLFQEGWKLIFLSPALVSLYILLFLVNGFAGIYAASYLGKITGALQMYSQTSEPSQPLFAYYAIWALLAFVVIAVLIPQSWIGSRMDLLMSNKLRDLVFNRVLRQDPEFFHANDPGKLNAVINSMTIETQMTLRQLILDPPLQMIMLIATGGVIIENFRNLRGTVPVLGLEIPASLLPAVIIAIALFSPYFVGRMGGNLRTVGREVQMAMLGLSSLVTSAAQSPEEIQLMKAEKFFADKHCTGLENSLRARLRQQITVGTLNVLNQLPTFVIQLLFLGIGLYVATRSTGESSVGNIVTILALSTLIMAPINALSSCMVMVSQSWPSIETILGLLERKGRIDQSASRSPDQEKAIAEPTLEARGVRFAYGPGLPAVFDNLSFRLPAGKRTALIAKMGQGKTSFFRLALRFYDPEKGEILVGGRPTTVISHAQIRQHIAMMSQFPAFFHDTLRENLRIAKPDATDEELISICRTTGMFDILTAKGLTLDSNLAGGQILSGGQKKLLALTRCLLRMPAILFLDEPTAGVDNNEKFKLLEMLCRATEGKTVVVVDHDVNWLLQFCDYFVGLNEGRTIESGTLVEVLTNRSVIYQLYTVAQGPKTTEISRYLVAQT